MPDAARLSDQAGHGGAIGPVVTGIAAKVMIGFMPAACQGDMQVCPASDGPKPHVGGAILKGSLTVKIGGKPAARMGDPTECKGPPGVIAKGEPTVKIGDMGMGGAGGSAGGSAEDAGTGAVAGAELIDVAAQIGSLKEASAEGMAFCQQCAQPPPPPPPAKAPPAEQQAEAKPGADSNATTPPPAGAPGTTEPTGIQTTFVAIELLDHNGKPVANEPCEVMLPNGESRSEKLDAQGKLRLDGIDPGTCQIAFPKLQERRRGIRKPS